ncbi:MAG: DNA repair protein RecN [Desulfuromonadales bacterium]|nr:DNA repair protein RecN [Desulfuromonadales bacterium]
MLTDLNITNFAIIDSLHVSFYEGLNILTGETGAGKSIIIDAVNLVLGGRASGDLIRTGAEEATVEALFTLELSSPVIETVREQGIECEDELLVKRIINRSGRNRVFINGALSTISILGDIASKLINIYGQHESQTLLRSEKHLDLLDDCSGLGGLVESYREVYAGYIETLKRIKAFDEGERDAGQRIDLLSFQSDEIKKAGLAPEEEVNLEQELNILVHSEKLLAASSSGYDLLYNGEITVLGALQQAIAQLQSVAAIDSSLSPVSEALSAAYLQLEDASLSLRDYISGIDLDPARLQWIDERLALMRNLKKKYGDTVGDILEYKNKIDEELELLKDRNLSKAELEEKLKELLHEIDVLGNRLTDERREGTERLQKGVQYEINQLAMKGAKFVVDIQNLESPGEKGFQKVEFLFSANPGEEPKPLAKIASGGELSRLMLAFKQVHPESDVPTLVFDEVDAGIGGATSALVGKKLKNVSKKQQVLCITHLPQVAAFAAHHFKVEKSVESGRTTTKISDLNQNGRVEEIARMLGGISVTDKSREHAKEMIAEASVM